MSYKDSATLTSKGQVTLPVAIRKRLGVNAGDKLIFNLSKEGKLVVTAHKRKSIFEDFDEVKLPSLGRPLTRKDISEASQTAILAKFGKRSK